jgi:protein tyrosine/serine phosphatase
MVACCATAGLIHIVTVNAFVARHREADRAILNDYLETNERFATGRGAQERQALLSSLREMVDDVACVIPVLAARAEYLAAAFEQAVLRYGSLDACVRVGLGADVEGLRATLLTSSAQHRAGGTGGDQA